MKKAIISVSDKEGIIEFAECLLSLGYTIYSTGGTLTLLEKNKLAVKSIKSLTKFPEILNGRVKTLHPQVHGGILADRNNKEHKQMCDEYSIELIDLVIVNLYPFEKTIEKKDVTLEEAIENIDIGGPTMIRASAKNFKHVGVVTSIKDYQSIQKELVDNKGKLTKQTKQSLAVKAFKLIAEYDISIADYFNQIGEKNTTILPQYLTMALEKLTDLRYGENPHQQAAIYKKRKEPKKNLNQLHGKELSYNNYLDIDAAIAIVSEFQLPGAVIIKHTNPCGAAVGDSLDIAYKRAYEADTVSAFGSIVGLNRVVDIKTAKELSQTFIEVIVAPRFDSEAKAMLSKKVNLRLIETGELEKKTDDNNIILRDINGAFLIQTSDDKKVSAKLFNCVTKEAPTKKQMNDLEFAFSLVKYIKSNAILIVKDGQTIGIGAGQMSRVDSVNIALEKAGKNAKGAVMASDAFFPFKDSVDLCVKYGINAIIQPGGSKRDQESIDACDKNKVSMVFTGSRHFKH